MLTNQGWKAVAIGPATSESFPESLNVESVIIAANTDSFNLLLLNYAGTAAPLQASNGLAIFAGGQVQNLYSGLIVQNGSLTVSNSQFIQEGGVVVTTNAWLRLDNGSYNLTNGLLQAGQVTLGLQNLASFVQDGGAANMTSLTLGGGLRGSGACDLYNGWLYVSGTLMMEGAQGTSVFNQHGGTNFTDSLVLSPSAGSSDYNLYGGMLCANYALVEADVSANFNQFGGDAFITNTMTIKGYNRHSDSAYVGSWLLSGGTLSAGTLDLNGNDGYSVYTQSNGTARIAGNILLDGHSHKGDLYLSGGTLACSNIYYSDSGDSITQTGGALIVSNLFSFGGTWTPFGYPTGPLAKYNFTGGTLSASNMELFAQWTIGSSAQASRITNPGWFKLGFADLHIGDADEHLGRLILATNTMDIYAPYFLSNSIIALDGTSSRLSFATSSAETWTPGATLIISNWNGNPAGGGAEQLKFGTSASALTASQLAQITFSNPAGFPAGNYFAKLLSTGELVPDTGGTGGSPVVNNWINPGSARWDSAGNWSLATLPASNQTVNITNLGYKAVNVDGATFANFPGSVTVSNLSVSAPTNALSTLLLNYAGLSTPLKVLNNCVIGANGTIDNFSSSFEVDGSAGGQLLVDGGSFTQVGGQTVVNAPVLVTNSGSLNATNGNMTLGDVTLGVLNGATDSPGTFNQSGGSIAAASLSLHRGTYNLYDGILYSLGGTAIPGLVTFNQYGGTNFGDLYMDAGYPTTYRLLAGLVRGTNITANFSSILCQGGGEVQAGSVNITGYAYPSQPNYVLTNGVLRVGTLAIHSSSFLQMNGQVIITNPLSIYGYDFPIPHTGVEVHPARYTMQAGTLSCPSLTVTQSVNYTDGDYASFTQSGGTNLVAGNLLLCSTTYLLDGGGLLQTSNSLTASGAAAQGTVNRGAVFEQRSGTHNVTGTLSIDSGHKYYINGGSLSVGGMWMHGLLAIGNSNGTPIVSCSGLLDLGGGVEPGVVQVQVGTHHLGSLRLTGNSSVGFGTGPARLNFDSSSSIAWSNGVSLVISNWNNSGGIHIFFGNNASTLTASQRAQIQFSNPGGYPPGNYGPQLLSTGELVPVAQPTLQSARYGSALVLTWSGNYQLLSSTNVIGPYAPVPGASSPWTNLFSKPHEFFRLQSL